MSQENVELVRQMLDAFNRGDVPAVIRRSQQQDRLGFRLSDSSGCERAGI
jgi:hypothetical protein